MLYPDATNGIDANVTQSQSTPTNDKVIPALGKYWHSMCSLRLLLLKQSNGTAVGATPITNKMERIVRIIKSNQLKTDNCCHINLSDIAAAKVISYDS